MPGLFTRTSDTLLRIALWSLLGFVLLVVFGAWIYVRTPYNQDRMFQIDQPVQFDHRHHVKDDGIECLYCHSGAERSASAGVPATEVCMGCHSQVWNRSELLQLVRDSYYRDRPIQWNRVHDLPDFVFFNHSVHVRAGVDCTHCHGDVTDMAAVYKVNSLTMGFCLDCHRDPKARVPNYRPSRAHPLRLQSEHARVSVMDNPLTTCTACHR